MLASLLLALLRYGLGGLFIVGESIAVAVLHSGGADIAGTVRRLEAAPGLNALEAAAGFVSSVAAIGLIRSQPRPASGLALLSGAAAWWYGLPYAAAALAAAAICIIAAPRG